MTASPVRVAGAALGVAAAAGAAAFVWGVAVERNRFTVRHETLPVLAPGARPITVLHLADLHMAPWQTNKQEWVASLRAIVEPDLIVNTGDNMGHPEGLAGVRAALDAFAGIPGVFVNGSNDYYGPQRKNPLGYFLSPSARPDKAVGLDVDAMERYFEEDLGWLDLNNAARALELRGSRLEFFGVNDAHRSWDRLDLLPGAIEEMHENVGWQDDPGPEPVRIGVTHAPYRRVLDSFVTHGAEVIFAGHTHGGQVRIPGRPALVTNCDIPREQAQGLTLWRHARHAAYLNVSAGIGTSIYAPFRFACPPEAVVVTLVAGDGEF
ncbi:putative MPP superfamily phosphohydrolase [Microbacteriaceae bacterium SG_E_30_P1]|uniref:MPP superfamily phosphohydrolase n=1 Tax=Antiquaquibacter oligotrophicus TaxID=2880260 RepID=A0ABT6KRM7_9MICO|nr:metallophosphoesterase [Antiquaquibacter oligotrophicus]MDH6181847.1 putative MPP superfamily phosphohydrolase [Antiquaquibacter oligotrophicus]UDF12476.1 metallophosphoesterase [Antiquaquibacter oligotrophicus]